MSRLLKLSLFVLFLGLGFYAKSAFAFTCTAAAGGGNWNAAGTWSGCNSTIPQAGDDVVFDATSGNVAVNVTTNGLKSLVMTGYTGTLSGSSQITITGSAAATNSVIFAGTISWTGLLVTNHPSGSTIELTTNGKALTTLTLNSAGTNKLMDNLTFAAVKTSVLTLNVTNGATLNMNGVTISGNSAINRVLITSSTLGTTRPITLNGGTFAYADFRDIAFANGGSDLNLSAITGLSGDCGGNAMSGGGTLTFTAAANQTWNGTSGGNWSTNAWTSRVPLCQDDAFVSSAFSSGQTVTMDMPRSGHTVDFSAATWSGTALTLNGSGNNTIMGSLKLVSGLLTVLNNAFIFEGRSGTLANGTSSSMPAGGWQIVNAGNTYNGAHTLQAFGGTYQLQDAYTTAASFSFNNGTFDWNNFNFTASGMASNNSNTRTLTMGSGTGTITGTGNAWNFATATGFTLNANTSTLILTNTTTTGKSFFGGGKTYNIVTFTGNNITVVGNNTIATFNLNNAGQSLGTLFTGTSTTTITTSLTTNATSTAARAIATSTNASIWEIKYTGVGTVCVDYMNIARSLATPASTWYAGANSLDSGNNSGWTFSACPAAVSTPPRVYINGSTYFNGNVLIE